MYNTTTTDIIVRLNYSKENPDAIFVNETEKDNNTFTGTIVWTSGAVEVETHRRTGFLDRDDVIGMTGIVLLPNQKDAIELAMSLNALERSRGKLGNRLPFVWMRIRLNGHEVSYRKAAFADENNRLIINEVQVDDILAIDGEIPDEALAEELRVDRGSNLPSRHALNAPRIRSHACKHQGPEHRLIERFFKGKNKSLPGNEAAKETQSQSQSQPKAQPKVEPTVEHLDPREQKIAELETGMAELKAMMQQMLAVQAANNTNGKVPTSK